jgi:hypothetical protein
VLTRFALLGDGNRTARVPAPGTFEAPLEPTASCWQAANDGSTAESRVAKSSIFDLGIGGRTSLAAVYLTIQVSLVLTAGLRPDGLFSFQMFNESSQIAITLGRRVPAPGGGTTIVATDGAWEASDASGAVHHFRWTDRIRDPILRNLGRPVPAAYGVAAQLFRLQNALDDVVSHLDGDAETRGLVADVRVWRNGRDSYDTRLESKRRDP